MVSEEPTRKLIRRLKAAGFSADRTVGSHTVYATADGRHTVTVPDGHKTISPGVVRQVNKAIEEAAK
ncbi:type II toxin-antitoxin system HicA family toxin [Leifsonia sp. McL0608]|uniref:type II toxin-antitoxin system HicA family toxin n=1 Tax=Leifsonia sp. McL0608 TaxID=3143537 RepID=UPI003D9C295A